MPLIAVEEFPPPRGTLDGSTYFRRGAGDAQVVATRPAGGMPRRDRPPFPANACPGQPPFHHSMTGLRDIWKNSVTQDEKNDWDEAANEFRQDRWASMPLTGNGWVSFCCAGLYSRWWNSDPTYLWNNADCPTSTALEYWGASVPLQVVFLSVTYSIGAQPKRGNTIHVFQIHPTRINSRVPWRFTRAIGQFDTWAPGERHYNFDFPVHWPIVAGESVWIYMREHAGTKSWNRTCHGRTAA